MWLMIMIFNVYMFFVWPFLPLCIIDALVPEFGREFESNGWQIIMIVFTF